MFQAAFCITKSDPEDVQSLPVAQGSAAVPAASGGGGVTCTQCLVLFSCKCYFLK